MNKTSQALEQKTADYALHLDQAAQLNVAVRSAVRAAIAPHLETIRGFADKLKAEEQEIRQLIDSNPDLFLQPKTKVLHGIKVGLRKQKGKLVIENPLRTIAQIEKRYQDDIGMLIKTTRTPLKSGLEKLPAIELKALGVQVMQDTDAVVFDVVEDSIDELFNFISLINTEEKENV